MAIESVYGFVNDDLQIELLEKLCPPSGIQTGPFGSLLHKKDYQPFGTPIITVEHLGENRIIHYDLPRVSDADKERLSRYVMQKGDIIFSRVGSVDRRALVRDEENGWLFSGRCLRVRPDPSKINPEYLSWFFGLEAFKDYIRRIAVGATMPSLNTELLSKVPIFFPPLPEQRAIAEVLGSLDDKIALNRRMNQTLEALAQAIFKSWFIDFEPVRAKMEGRPPAGMDAEMAALFPDAMDGDVPSGWRKESIFEIADLIGGGTPSTSNSEYWNGDILWVSAKDVSNLNGIFILQTEKTITESGVKNSSTRILPTKTTIVTARGTVGACCLLGKEMAMNQTNYGFVSKDKVYPYFVFFSLLSIVQQLRQYSYGTIFDTITTKTFENTPCTLPPKIIIHKFEKLITPFMDLVLQNQYQSLTLSVLRDTLLPKLLSGEVRIKDVEHVL